jgi:hypothetical protein
LPKEGAMRTNLWRVIAYLVALFSFRLLGIFVVSIVCLTQDKWYKTAREKLFIKLEMSRTTGTNSQINRLPINFFFY